MKSTKEIIKDLTMKDATHGLHCSHSFNSHSRISYFMECVKLKEMYGGLRAKILVFGERNKPGHDEKKRIRYVNRWRLIPKGGY